jgi:hypothetical protein
MRTLRSGDMYMFPMSSDIYAAVPSRVWWAPWRWSLEVMRWGSEAPNTISWPQIIATNITKAECIGLMKVLGYEEEITC